MKSNFAKFSLPRPSRIAALCTSMCAGMVLIGCQQSGLDISGLTGTKNTQSRVPQQVTAQRQITPNPIGQKVGNGPVRIALLLPTSAAGDAGTIAKQMANAARLAVRDVGTGRIEVIIKNTGGQANQSRVAANEARDEGASLILGPLLSDNVAVVSPVAQSSGIPMIAFTSDTTRARRGSYLLSFAPDDDVQRTLEWGLANGANQIVALLPDNAYGAVAERNLRRTYDRANNGQIVSVIKYARNTDSIVTAARSAALPLANGNALYIPDGGQIPALILNTLTQGGVSLQGKQIMGSGQWSGIDLRPAIFQGAVFAGVDRQNFAAFSQRYQKSFGAKPAITAALAYDAVSMAAQLTLRKGTAPFIAPAIESYQGFRGATGLFRFRSNGRLERGQVVNRVKDGRVQIVSPAPRTFQSSG